MDLDKDKEKVYSEAFQTDWKDRVIDGQSYDGCRQDILETLQEFGHMWKRRLGRITNAKPCIGLFSQYIQPLSSAPFQEGGKERESENLWIYKLLRLNVTEPAQSKWASRIMFAPNWGGSLRLCIYFQEPNVIPVKDAYPITRMDECTISPGEARIFSRLHANSGY